jgi:hypothetical protein
MYREIILERRLLKATRAGADGGQIGLPNRLGKLTTTGGPGGRGGGSGGVVQQHDE